MINDHDVDRIEFANRKSQNLIDILEKNLDYDQLLEFAAQMMTERNYAEDCYHLATADVESAMKNNGIVGKQLKELIDNGYLWGKIKAHTEAGKKAVSCREDQIIKPQWQEHVRQCWERGVSIHNIDDLLSQPLANPKICKVTPNTLKQWAKEAVPELSFKAGRPKKNTPHRDK